MSRAVEKIVMQAALHVELPTVLALKLRESGIQLTVFPILFATELWKDLSACRLSAWLRPFTVIAFATTPAHCSVPCVATGRSTSLATADTTRRARTSAEPRHLQYSTTY